MKLKKIKLWNFKGYEEAEINFEKISLIVGANDSGKSSILHALDLFFNNNLNVKPEELFFKGVDGETSSEFSIECHFEICDDDLEITLGDESIETSIKKTNLLTNDGYLAIGSRFSKDDIDARGKLKASKYIICHNYNLVNSGIESLKSYVAIEEMKNKELTKVIESLELKSDDKRKGIANRDVILQHVKEVIKNKSDVEIPLGAKHRFHEIFKNKLPFFKLFSNDGSNISSNKEHSGIIESEVKSIIEKDMASQIDLIKREMLEKMKGKIESMNQVYNELFDFLGKEDFSIQDGNSKIDFKCGNISDGKNLDIDSRGSGFRRLALLSLHLSSSSDHKNRIYAIEEPETSQNPKNQKGIIEAISRLHRYGAQVIVTTHSPSMAKEFDPEMVNYTVVENDLRTSSVVEFEKREDMLAKVIDVLGVMPLDIVGKKTIVFVEGKDDVSTLNIINKIFFQNDEVIFLFGGNLDGILHHISFNYFKNLKKMVLVDKVNAENEKKYEKIKEKFSENYPDFENNEKNYIIKAEKDDITNYWKIPVKSDDVKKKISGIIKKYHEYYFDLNELDCHIKDKRLKKVQEELRSDCGYSEDRASIELTKNDFNDFEEMESWFRAFKVDN